MWTKTAILGLLALSSLWGQGSVHLKSRTIPTPRGAVAGVEGFSGRRHYVLQFNAFPGPEIRRELARRGVRVVGYVPDSALMVSSEAGVDLRSLGVNWAGALESADKISSLAAEAVSPVYLVMFHPDVEADMARALILERGFVLLENASLLGGQYLASGNATRLEDLAALDEVAYILPASADLAGGAALHGCPGAASEAGLAGDYALAGRGWSRDSSGVAALQYAIASLTTKMNPESARSEIERALREWARYANLRLEPGGGLDSARTIAFQFSRRSHGDGYSFDGAGGVLAHTFYPSPPNLEPIAGDVHFDSEESWGTVTDLFTVALHEAGHALGLGHSDRPGSVMYPYYRLATALSADDIAGIRALYGSSDAPSAPPETPSEPATPTIPTTPSTPSTPPTPPTADRIAPLLRITSPAATIVSAYSASIRITGISSDNTAVASVKWVNSTGKSGTAAGTGSWTAQIPLLVGTNVVTIRAYDAAGNSSWRAVTVVRR